MLQISRSTLRQVNVGTDEAFAEWFVEDIMKTWMPQFYYSVSDDSKRQMVINGRGYARGFGFHDQKA